MGDNAERHVSNKKMNPVLNGEKGQQGYLVAQVAGAVGHVSGDVIVGDLTRQGVDHHRLYSSGNALGKIPQVGYINVALLAYALL